MRKGKVFGLIAVTATFLLAGCSRTVDIGPVPTITPRPTVTPAPTPTPVVTEEKKDDVVEEVSVYDTKKFKEYYETENELPQLKVAYEDLFTVGLDVLQIDVTDLNRQKIIKEQFNSISVKNDLSPNYLMDYEASRASGDLNKIALDFTGADVILRFAQANGIPVRGPKLITNETPAWAFTKDFSEDQVVTTEQLDGTTATTIEFASEDVILARLENYIKDVITYCNTNYPGLVVSWDVLDDVVSTTQGDELKYRTDSYWYQVLGGDYLKKSCEFARKYATAGQKLFYSQDGLDEVGVKNASVALIELLMADKLLDGVAIQAHYNPNGPNVFSMDDMMKALVATGLEIHYTEFYVDSNENNEGDADKTVDELKARAAKRYKNLMTTVSGYETKKSYDIVNITFEGLTNETSYLNEPKEYWDPVSGQTILGVKIENYPYFFDKDLNVTDNFFAALGDATIKGY